MRKRVIIVRRNCHEFANQLWSDMAIYAYACLVNARMWNLALLETGPFAFLHTAIASMLGRTASSVQYQFLPPTTPLEGKFAQRNTLYFFGWLFRNQGGFARYRKELLEKFGPSRREEARLTEILAGVPAGRVLIGVRMRLAPFPLFPNGEFLVSPERVREVVSEYMCEHTLVPEQVALVLVTDRPVPNVFEGFAVCSATGNERTDFLLLSKCSVVIGTNTTFCNLASWFGDVPHIVTTKNPINWGYYADKPQYFENTYATFTFGVRGQD